MSWLPFNGISLQNYWFDELGQRYRYRLALGLRLQDGVFYRMDTFRVSTLKKT
jgi:hypothetical protein